MTTQEYYVQDPTRSPIHEAEEPHFLERNISIFDQLAGDGRVKSFMDLPFHEVEQPNFLERNGSVFGQPPGDGSLKSSIDLPFHELEQPNFLERNVSVLGQSADEWRDNKSVKEAAYKFEKHTKSSDDVSDEDEDESTGDRISVGNGDIDALVASVLNKMTLKEREEVMFDVHGVSEVIEENPDMVACKLEELESILAKKRTKKKAAAYNLAVSMSSDYVKNRKLLLMFLRADRFHAKKAAWRMMSHFHKKLELFGASKLCKDITLEDLDPHAMEVIENGHLTVLPARDQADRLVFCCVFSQQRYREPVDQIRAMFYILMSFSQDEDVQKNGVVVVGYMVGSASLMQVDRSLIKQVTKLTPAFPFRMASLHRCYSDNSLSPLLDFAAFNENTFTQTRTRTHKGNHKEVQQKLATFGILPQSLPVSADGELKLENHREWLQMRRVVEGELDERKARTIITPSRYDILFGRGCPIRDNPGNLGLLFLVEKKRSVYDAADKQEKTRISLEIVRMLKAKPSRFLKKNASGIWEEVDEDMARLKVSHAFRTMRAPTQKVESTTKVRIVWNEDADKHESIRATDSLGKRAKRA